MKTMTNEQVRNELADGVYAAVCGILPDLIRLHIKGGGMDIFKSIEGDGIITVEADDVELVRLDITELVCDWTEMTRDGRSDFKMIKNDIKAMASTADIFRHLADLLSERVDEMKVELSGNRK